MASFEFRILQDLQKEQEDAGTEEYPIDIKLINGQLIVKYVYGPLHASRSAKAIIRDGIMIEDGDSVCLIPPHMIAEVNYRKY
uniref:Uncharacterized protein n=1 Tax=Ochrobactrum phage ORM_20 TaxID=2985243 RepID=A0A9N6WZF2_9VIRU|nr:hypothetical protein ORM20_00090 [Ochrobactrum phage ORM_20]